MSATVMLAGIGYLMVYMYLSLNFLMLALESKVKLRVSFRFPFALIHMDTIRELSLLMSAIQNPKGYIKARFYGLGALAMNILPIIWVFSVEAAALLSGT